jgi:reductive dehalogenase
MKGLGLGAAGLGAAAASAPVFHDLDEAISAASSATSGSTTSMMDRPWWVKEVDKPTVEIDFTLRESFKGFNAAAIVLAGLPPLTSDDRNQLRAHWAQISAEGIAQNKPGWSLRDQIAVYAGLDTSWAAAYPTWGFRQNKTHTDLGAPKWQGTPEENSLMMRTILNLARYDYVGYVDISDNSLGDRTNLFNKNTVDFENSDDYRQDGGMLYLPTKTKYVMALMGAQSEWDRKLFAAPAAFLHIEESYARRAYIQNFLWGLGYQSYSPSCTQPPFGILSGIGEYDRTHGPSALPEGNVGNGLSTMLTDLPLAPTKPIDFGVLKFCETCGRCAEACPSGAIPTRDQMKEPTWERATGPWSSSNDHKGYPNESVECAKWYMANTCAGQQRRPVGFCGICVNACVFKKRDIAWVHYMAKAKVATTSLFNKFFADMDDFAGYGGLPTDEERKSIWTEPIA